MNDLRLKDIYTYPVKSLGGVRLQEGRVLKKGLEFDRRWMLVDDRGRFMSQRKHSRMALLQTEITDNGIDVYSKTDPSNRVTIPLEPSSKNTREVVIWDDRVDAQRVSQKLSQWFSEQLDVTCDLVFMPHSTRRLLKPKYQVNEESVSFADAMPYLLISQKSLDDLNSRLNKPIPMERFRPNIVVAGGAPFQEDNWNEISIGSARFKITKSCARCVVTTIDQQSGHKAKEPLKTLASYRKVEGDVYFGQNMLLLEGGNIQVGDTVSLIPGV
ncbi:MOSC domain-containing protein [Rhodohalobacter sp. 8-1]|uniref:MOSC domain-containing protein n=1 Tax=Rhodohalobacter sp. 8-1 TaxID=3131972 RepID=UPI0030EEF5D2